MESNVDDISLYVPWNENSFKMQEELETIVSIHKKNLHEFSGLRSEIRNLFSFEKNPVKIGQCVELNKHYRDKETNFQETLSKCDFDYNLLLEEEVQLQNESNEIDKNLKKVLLEMAEYEEKEQNVKKLYQSHKTALSLAKNIYGNTLGMEVQIEEQNGDVFTANVHFPNVRDDYLLKLKADRKLNQIMDLDVNALVPAEEVEKFKNQFKQTNNILDVICTLRNYVINKTY